MIPRGLRFVNLTPGWGQGWHIDDERPVKGPLERPQKLVKDNFYRPFRMLFSQGPSIRQRSLISLYIALSAAIDFVA
jgi:hypothetical protein